MKVLLRLFIVYSLSFLMTTQAVDVSSLPDFSTIETEEELQEAIKKLTPEQLELLHKAKEEFDLLTNKVLTQAEKLDAIIEGLAIFISNGTLKNIDVAAVRKELIHYRQIIQTIKNNLSISVQPQAVTMSIVLIHELLGHFQALVKSGLKDINHFVVEDVFNRGKEQDFDYEALVKHNALLLPTIEKETNNIGLSKLNHCVQAVCAAHNNIRFAPRLVKMGIYSLLFCTFIAKIGPDIVGFDSENKPIPNSKWSYLGIQQLKNFIGDWPIAYKGRLTTDHIVVNAEFKPNPLYKGFGRFMHTLCNRLGVVDLTLPAFFTFQTIKPMLYEDWNNASNWVTRHWTNTLNKLQGKPIKVIDPWDGDPKFTFADIIGNEHAKALLMEEIVEYVCNAETFDRAQIRPQKGYLFTGKSRSGKTMAAEAVAGEVKARLKAKGNLTKVRWISLTPSIIAHYGGMANIWRMAHLETGVSIIFVDEADMLGLQRDRDHVALSELLQALSGYQTETDSCKVILIFATNKPENFDNALQQHGRIGKRIHFEFPNTEQRLEYLTMRLEKQAISFSHEFLYKIAVETEECSFETLKAVISKAIQKAKIRNGTVTEQDFEDAIDLEVRKILPNTYTYQPHEKQFLAAHLAGHVLVSHLLSDINIVTKATLHPVSVKPIERPVWAQYDKDLDQAPIEYGKVFTVHHNTSDKCETYNDLITEVKVYLAGQCAEQLLLQDKSYSYHSHDIPRAFSILKFLTFRGINEERLAKEIRQQKLLEVDALLKQYEQEVMMLLENNKHILEILTAMLIERESLSRGEILAIIDYASKQPSEQAENSVAATA